MNALQNPASAPLPRSHSAGRRPASFVALLALAALGSAALAPGALGAPLGALLLAPPAATPEEVGPQDDFPFFLPPAGSQLSGTGIYGEPLDVTVPGSGTEITLVGIGYLVKSYSPPPSLSRLEFEKTYRAALAAAGWQVAPPSAEGEGIVVAHYFAGGRNLWLVASRSADDGRRGIEVKVADLGAEDWGAKLDRDCRLPLYGIGFDPQGHLLPESSPLLDKAREVLAARPEVRIEVQGHTESTGQNDFNAKLSQARADEVAAWLIRHGIATSRLTAKGYGAAWPIADNRSAAGRAVNRRVELVTPGCDR